MNEVGRPPPESGTPACAASQHNYKTCLLIARVRVSRVSRRPAFHASHGFRKAASGLRRRPSEYVGAILRGDRQPETDWDLEYRRMGVLR
jgi:hypothetical protein